MRARRDQDVFWEGVDRGELVAQQCLDCETLRHPPSPHCAKCGSEHWHTRPLSGRGVIHTWLVSTHPNRHTDDERLVILVDLEEGVRIVSNLLDPENARSGAPVALEFGEIAGARLPLFRTIS